MCPEYLKVLITQEFRRTLGARRSSLKKSSLDREIDRKVKFERLPSTGQVWIQKVKFGRRAFKLLNCQVWIEKVKFEG